MEWIDALGFWKGQPRKLNGTFGPGANPARRWPEAPDPTKKVHGNSKDSEVTAALYGRFDADGNFEKWGISQNPNIRYSTTVLDGGRIKIKKTGARSEILKQERRLVERFSRPT